MAEERRFFMSHVDSLSMHLTFFQNSVTHHKDMFVIDSDFLVSSVVRLLDDSIDHTGYERLKVRGWCLKCQFDGVDNKHDTVIVTWLFIHPVVHAMFHSSRGNHSARRGIMVSTSAFLASVWHQC